jgi:acetolactate synthase-1/2/3 large subunit
MMGMHGEAWVNKAIQDSDLIIAVGMRFDDRVTGRIAEHVCAKKARKKIHIELDPSRDQQERASVDLPIVGDAKDVL